MSELILHTTEDGRSQIKLRADQQTVWLTQLEMAELFDATKQHISLHLKKILKDGELSEDADVKEFLTTPADVKRYRTQLYNLRTKRREEIRMSFWRQNVDQIISSNGFPVLAHAGKVSHEQMERSTNALYLDYDQRRKQDEARQVDEQDGAELKALENTLKKRPKP